MLSSLGTIIPIVRGDYRVLSSWYLYLSPAEIKVVPLWGSASFTAKPFSSGAND